jgi:DHA2 family multidrug resistance protein
VATTADPAMTAAPADRPARDPVLQGWELVLGIGALGLVSFVGILDLTIVNVILPSIGSTFSASPHEVTMGITCFAAAQAVATPVTGWLSTRFGVIRVFMLSLVGFAVASLLCGLAPSLASFVVARVLQGCAAGPLLPVVQTLLQRSVPKHLLPAAFAFWATVISAAPLVGPIVGGAMADSIGWPWGFYINIPFLIVAIAVIWRIYGDRETPMVKVPLDHVGLVLMVIWVAALQFALDKGADLDWFSSPLIITLLVTAVIGLIAFLIWEFTDDHPLIDFSVFRYRSFLIGTPVSTISYSSMSISSLLLTLWLQFGMGYNATWAGYAVAVMGVTSMIAGPLCAILTGCYIDRRSPATSISIR